MDLVGVQEVRWEEYIPLKNTDALVVASKENRLEVNADKTKYMVMSLDPNAGRSHNIKLDHFSFKIVEKFKQCEQP